MGDQDGSRELPRRVRGTARAGPAPPAPPVLSEELRQRLQAAVRAERGEAVGPDQEPVTKPEWRLTPSAPARGNVTSPAANGNNGASEPERAVKPEARKPTVAPVKSERTVEPEAPKPAVALVRSERTAEPIEPIEPVKREPVTPEPADDALSDYKPAILRPTRPARPRAGARKQPFGRLFVAAGLVLIAAGALGITVTRYTTRTLADIDASNAALRHEAVVDKQAATWVAEQVSPDAIVSCDPVMCAALAAEGIPRSKLLVLTSTSTYPLSSAVVVETAAVLSLFGTSLNNYAPAVLATFGSGDSQITVRIIASTGAGAYYKALSADLAARKLAGNALLQSSAITVSPTARRQLIAGQPASRLLLAIAFLASDQPIDIVQFGNIGPGADADIPLRFADLAESDPAAHMASSAYVRAIRAYLSTVSPRYRPASVQTVVEPGNQAVLRIQFTAPSPLGLIGPQASP